MANQETSTTAESLLLSSRRYPWLRLFGSPLLYGGADATPLPLDSSAPNALLVYLAARPGWHTRASLAQTLRPEADAATARSHLRRLLHRLRESAGGQLGIEVEDDRLRWVGSSDIEEFGTAVLQGQWSIAASLHHQPLLHDARMPVSTPLDEWLAEERQQLRQRLGTALMALLEQGGDDPARIELMTRLAENDPLDEHCIQFLLQQARTPQERLVAVTAYQTLHRRLAAELGISPLPRTLELFRQLGHQPRAPAASAPGLVVAPMQATPALAASPVPAGVRPLGRDREAAAIRELLVEGVQRLVTIGGLGGIGKTSLARLVFCELSAADSTRVSTWVDLDGADTLQAYAEAVAFALGIQVRDGSADDRVLDWLRCRQHLLFFDNFDLPGAEGFAQRILARAPGVSIVATSRHRLNLAQEQFFLLQGLECTGPLSPAALLFKQHSARLGNPVAARQGADVADLCAYLDGFPLAIELAAAWSTVLAPADILAELKKDPLMLDAATDLRRSGAARTLQSVLACAWRRLDVRGQSVLTALCTICGPIDLQAAREMASATDGELLVLVSAALLQRAGNRQYRLHPLVREFVLSNANPQMLEQARSQHARYMLAACAEPPPLQVLVYAPHRIQKLAPMAEDIVRAWDFACRGGDTNLLVSAIANIVALFLMTRRNAQLLDMLRHAVQLEALPVAIRHNLLALQARCMFVLGWHREAQAVAAATLASSNEPAALAISRHVLARHARYRGDHASAVQHALEGAAVAQRADAQIRLFLLDEATVCHWWNGDFLQAERLAGDNLQLARQHGSRWSEARAMYLLAMAQEHKGDASGALATLQDALKIYREIDDGYEAALCIRFMTWVYRALGDHAKQLECALQALQMLRMEGHVREEPEALFGLVSAYDAAGRHVEAVAAAVEALALARAHDNLPIVLRSMFVLGGYGLARERQAAVRIMAFVLSHAALRKRDVVTMEAWLKALQVSPDELASAREQLTGQTLESLNQEVRRLFPSARLSLAG